jgi:hypothetical protein
MNDIEKCINIVKSTSAPMFTGPNVDRAMVLEFQEQMCRLLLDLVERMEQLKEKAMNSVYLLKAGDGDQPKLLGVFSTPEAAAAFMEAYALRQPYIDEEALDPDLEL